MSATLHATLQARIVPDVGENDVSRWAGALRKAICAAPSIKERTTTANFGDNLTAWIKRADDNLYRAKSNACSPKWLQRGRVACPTKVG